MKGLFCSDPHIGRYKYGKVNERTGNDTRSEDVLKNFDEIIDHAIEKKVQVFVAGGDFYHIKKPQDIYKKLLAKRFERILNAKIQLILLVGNHDQGRTAAHNLSEIFELNSQIPLLHIVEEPKVIHFDDAELYILPYVNRFDLNLSKEVFPKFQLEHIRKFAKQAAKNNKLHYFFGHFATSLSKSANSFDLGSLTDLENSEIVDIKEFDKKIWTKVYLGHIHKHQEMNDFCKHSGSTARVDFGEELEEKGFYYFEDKKDEFVELNDRKFKTLDLNLFVDDPRKEMEKFCNDIQDLDLKQTITRLRVKIKAKDRKLIKFEGVENYLKEETWSYIGKNVTEIQGDREDIRLETSEDLNYVNIFNEYIKKISLDESLLELVKKEGEKVLIESMEI